jgi:hypothetical protein
MDDHAERCEGRNYTCCTCGYEEAQAAEIKRLQDALRNAAEIVLGAGYPLVAEHMRQIAGETK